MWCFRVLLSGIWLARKWKYKSLMGGVGNAEGSLWQGGSSLPSFGRRRSRLPLQLAGPNNGEFPCFGCWGSRSTLPITDLRATARRGSLDLADKYDLFNDPRVGPSAFYVQLEKLHLMDLGVRHHFGGHMFYLFLIDCGVRSSFEERAEVVWSTLLKAYGELNLLAGERLPEILFTLLPERRGCSQTHKEYPQLFTKAAAAQQFAPHAAACALLRGPLAASATCASQMASSSLVAWAPSSSFTLALPALIGRSAALRQQSQSPLSSTICSTPPSGTSPPARVINAVAKRVLAASSSFPNVFTMIWHNCFPCSMSEAHESLPVLALNDHELAPYVIPAP